MPFHFFLKQNVNAILNSIKIYNDFDKLLIDNNNGAIKMDMKKVLLISLIAVAILASVSAVTAGFLDGLAGEPQDNVVELDEVTFNTTNETNFTVYVRGIGNIQYESFDDLGKYAVWVGDFDALEDPKQVDLNILEKKNNLSSQTVNGTVVYTDSIKHGEYMGETIYLAVVENSQLNKKALVWSSDPNETVKMASSLKFN